MEVRVNIEPSRNFSSKHLAVFKNDSAGRWRGAPSNIHTAGPLDFKRGVHLAGRNLAVFAFSMMNAGKRFYEFPIGVEDEYRTGGSVMSDIYKALRVNGYSM